MKDNVLPGHAGADGHLTTLKLVGPCDEQVKVHLEITGD